MRYSKLCLLRYQHGRLTKFGVWNAIRLGTLFLNDDIFKYMKFNVSLKKTRRLLEDINNTLPIEVFVTRLPIISHVKLQ